MLQPLPTDVRYRVFFDRKYGSVVVAEAVARTGHFEFVMKCPVNKPGWLFQSFLCRYARERHPAVAQKFVGKEVVTALSCALKKSGEVQISNFLTNCHGSEPTRGCAALPAVVQDYRAHSHYVDVMNQLHANIEYEHRHSSWERSMIDWALALCVSNARIAFNESNVKHERIGVFLMELCNELAPRPSTSRHILEEVEHRGHCKWCARKGKDVRTWFRCGTCAGQPPLCEACFDDFHGEH